MAKPRFNGLTRIIETTGYSAKGLRPAWKYESAFPQEEVLTGTLIPFAVWLSRDAGGIGILISSLSFFVIV